ncbi:hypothetical protein [Lentzea sp. NEAU-D7]|uniref:DUF7178 family protein n=1 Tax=Lentzea sp. NEAU-D7 TaxID=2994667 RepID=UPI00224AFC60|nr:hypothetical protein [Lentzea sp. NEAU-D7]MCX2949922.1 hypothetical protein [Lentzea sp. NEAU-D7]
MPDVKVSVRNITRIYRAATTDDRVEGRGWYATAREIAESLDPEDPARAAAVIAVLSPQLSWRRNVIEAQNAYAGRPIKTLGLNAEKARRILAGENPEDVVSGPKVRAFWRTIADPSDPRAVVIDRHAIDIAAGRVLGDKVRGVLLSRAGAYDEVCDVYRRAARILSREFGTDLSPAAVQATTWVHWRREYAALYVA